MCLSNPKWHLQWDVGPRLSQHGGLLFWKALRRTTADAGRCNSGEVSHVTVFVWQTISFDHDLQICYCRENKARVYHSSKTLVSTCLSKPRCMTVRTSL